MPKFRYVPVLRSKAGEATALENLGAADKQRMLPLMHVSGTPAAGFAKKVSAAWASMPMALDGLFHLGATGQTVEIGRIFHELGKGGVAASIVVDLGTIVQIAAGLIGPQVGLVQACPPGFADEQGIRGLPDAGLFESVGCDDKAVHVIGHQLARDWPG